MTRARWIGMGVLTFIVIATTIWAYVLMLQGKFMGSLGVTIPWAISVHYWRFAAPVVPNREGLIWATGWVIEKVDDVLKTVRFLLPVFRSVLVASTAVACAFWMLGFAVAMSSLSWLAILPMILADLTLMVYVLSTAILPPQLR
jgi:hypothetical protein